MKAIEELLRNAGISPIAGVDELLPLGQRLAGVLSELRLKVERVDLADAAVHEQLDHPFDLGPVMDAIVQLRPRFGRFPAGEHLGESNRPESVPDLAQGISATKTSSHPNS